MITDLSGPDSESSLSPWWVAGGVTALAMVVVSGWMVGSYRTAHSPRHSDSMIGMETSLPSCAGPLQNWIDDVDAHYAKQQPAESPTFVSGLKHFAEAVLPWHWQSRPQPLLLFGLFEIATWAAAFVVARTENAQFRAHSSGAS